jgi:putative flippase GtrA
VNRHTQEVIRYAINGVVATAVHYGILTFNLSVLGFASAGLANLVAAIFGISVSFVGSRYFVFPGTDEAILTQAIKFSVLYGAIAVCHGMVLFIWTDLYTLDYRVGFLIATIIQVTLSYLGNKFLVFKT